MRKRAAWLSVGGGVAGAIILVAIAVSLIAARSEPITSATIVRTRAPESIPAASFSPHTVNDAAKAQRLYDAVRALKPLPANGMWSCPIDFGTRYQLTFRSTSGIQLIATLDGGGCRFLQIEGGQGYYTDAAFWQLLADTFGVSDAQLFPVPPR
jgi:hypothetical protein